MKDNWERKSVEEIGEVISGGTPSTSIPLYWDGNIPWITPSDLSKMNYPNISKSKKTISDLGLRNSSANLIPAYSIVMSSRAPIGYFAIPNMTFTTNQGCKSVVLNSDQDVTFYYYNFLFNVMTFKNRGEGTTFAEISKKVIEILRFTVPPLPQQQKIAQILSTCDTVLEKTESAIAKYKAIKQGLLHDLFTRGIDPASGELRPSYEEAPELYKEMELGFVPREWEVEKLSNLTSKIVDGTHFTPNYTDYGIPFLRVTDVQSENVDLDRIKFVSETEHKELIKRCNPEKGDILYSKNGTIGIPKLINWDWEFSIFVSLALIKPINSLILSEYLSLLLPEEVIWNQIRKRSKQGTVTNLHLEEIREFQIPLPSINEQKAIIEGGNTINQKIESEQHSLAKYQAVKAGLMQDLLSGAVGVEELIKNEI